MTILEVIQRSADFLGKRGVESPRLQVELLLAHVLKMPRMKLYLNFERVLAEPELNQLREMVQRRGKREPLQYIVGTTSFCGFEILVNPHTLIPRPETELLAEWAWKFLLSTLNSQHSTVLDFGTGSGCLAVAIAAKCPTAKVHALDFSPDALNVARQNATRNNVAERIEFQQGDSLAALPAGTRFDLIVSNPPYIPSAEIEKLEPEVRDFEPHSALDGGADGLNFYRAFAEQARNWLVPGGKIMLEFGDGQAEELRKIFTAQNWIVEAVEEDYTRRPRILIALPKS